MKVLQTVNLGKTLSTNAANVRYSVYDTLGSIKVSATNSGIYELGTSTGIYGAELNLSTQFSGSILWSVTNAPSVFATEEIKIDQKMARYIHTGRWKIDKDEKQMIFYQDDNTTEIAKYELLDADGAASVTDLFERKLIGTGSV
jgi:hypothetical protein